MAESWSPLPKARRAQKEPRTGLASGPHLITSRAALSKFLNLSEPQAPRLSIARKHLYTKPPRRKVSKPSEDNYQVRQVLTAMAGGWGGEGGCSDVFPCNNNFCLKKVHQGVPSWLSGLRIWCCQCCGYRVPGQGTSTCLGDGK